jgi:hypothetical protein
MHELIHRLRQHEPCTTARDDARQELACEIEAARLLIPLHTLADALLWGKSPAELAEELWVDVQTLKTRILHMEQYEKDYVNGKFIDNADWGAA